MAKGFTSSFLIFLEVKLFRESHFLDRLMQYVGSSQKLETSALKDYHYVFDTYQLFSIFDAL